MAGNLRGNSLRHKSSRPDVNPMDGLANLVDVMLVFACGLMMALIINWNLDISLESVELTVGDEITEDTDKMTQDMQDLGSDSSYENMGVLYKDPETGKLYLLTEAND